jgi:hypothetical protein
VTGTSRRAFVNVLAVESISREAWFASASMCAVVRGVSRVWVVTCGIFMTAVMAVCATIEQDAVGTISTESSITCACVAAHHIGTCCIGMAIMKIRTSTLIDVRAVRTIALETWHTFACKRSI